MNPASPPNSYTKTSKDVQGRPESPLRHCFSGLSCICSVHYCPPASTPFGIPRGIPSFLEYNFGIPLATEASNHGY